MDCGAKTVDSQTGTHQFKVHDG